MKSLQVSDPPLRHVLTEWLAAQTVPSFAVTDASSDVVLSLENNEFILTADGHDVDRFSAPVRLAELVVDISWLMVRRSEESKREIKLCGQYILEPHAFAVRHGDAVVALTGREVTLLQFMAQVGECSKETLLAEVWHYHPDSDTHTIETHLWRLRQKLAAARMTASLIVTTDKGYRIAHNLPEDS